MIEPVREQQLLNTDPNKWVPFEKQEQFIELPFSIKEGIFGGSVGTGKTDLLLRLLLIYGFHKHPLFKGILLRRTFDDLEKEVIPRAKRLFGTDGKKGFGARYHEGYHRFTFPSGGLFFLGHCEHDDDIENYDGNEYNIILWDELGHFNERPYLYLSFSRSRSATDELPAIVRSSVMPGGDGHHWVKKRFVDPAPDGGKVLYSPKSNSSRIFIKALPYDNPYLVKNNPNYYNELNALSEADRRAKLGDWNAFQGQVFTEYREEPFKDEPNHACHLIDDNIQIQSSWPAVLSVDIGTTALTYGLFGVIAPNSQVISDREFAVNGGSINYPDLPQNVDIATWASELGNIARQYNLVDIVLDSTAFESRPEGVTIAELFQRHSGLSPRRADKGPGSRIQGRLTLQEYLRWKDKPSFWKKPTTEFDRETALRILRIEGEEKYRAYVGSFNEPEKEILPKLLIKKRCKLLREAIPVCVYDSNHVEDIAEFHGDDPIDTLRYLIRAIDFYRTSNIKYHGDEERIVRQIQDAHIANMMLEKLHSKKSVGVRRTRRRI